MNYDEIPSGYVIYDFLLWSIWVRETYSVDACKVPSYTTCPIRNHCRFLIGMMLHFLYSCLGESARLLRCGRVTELPRSSRKALLVFACTRWMLKLGHPVNSVGIISHLLGVIKYRITTSARNIKAYSSELFVQENQPLFKITSNKWEGLARDSLISLGFES